MALRQLAAVCAAAAGLVLMAGPALAAAPYTVTFDGNPAGTFTEIFTNTAPVVFSDNGLNLTCNTSILTVNVTAGAYNSDPANVATIGPATFTDCDFDGLPMTVAANTPWQVNVTGGNTSAPDDTVTGTVTGVDADVSIDGPLGTCSFVVTGSVNGNFLESSPEGGQELDAIPGPGLTISDVDNAITCIGLVNNGDAPTFTGQYASDNQDIQIS